MRDEDGVQGDALHSLRRESPERQMTSSPEMTEDKPLGLDTTGRGTMIQHREQSFRSITNPALHGDSPLARSREHPFQGLQPKLQPLDFENAKREIVSEAAKSSRGKDGGIEGKPGSHLSQTGGDITTNRNQIEIRTTRFQEQSPAGTA